MARLGVMGGTFDPIHVGHMLLAQFALEALDLDRVLFVPAADPPHKDDRKDIAPAEDRWGMVVLALEGVAAMEPSRIELDRPGKSYTVDTLHLLRQQHGDVELFLIIGADNIAQMSTWYKPYEILQLCTVVAGARNATEVADERLARHITRIDTPLIELSSTQIRQRLAAGLPVRYMVPEQVEAFIRQKGLYS